MWLSAVALLVLSVPGRPEPPSANALPDRLSAPLVLDVCSQVAVLEDFAGPTNVGLITATDPHASACALFGLVHLCRAVPPTPEDFIACERLEADLDKVLYPVPVEVPPAGETCLWQPVQPGAAPPDDLLVFRFSSPIAAAKSPCGKAGIFLAVRLSGTFGPDWYWVPLKQVGGVWIPGEIQALDVHD